MTSKKHLKRHMENLLARRDVEDLGIVDRGTGQASATQLAYVTALDFGHDEWLDDDLHVVWDAAAEVADEFDEALVDQAELFWGMV